MKGKYKKLFIIGNGFDIWQGLPTSYGSFKEYYKANIKRIAKELHAKITINENGRLITPVEMIFGDITHPDSLSEEFFWNMESSMALLDDQQIIDHFPKSKKGVRLLQRTVDKAHDILQKVFGEWIASISVEQKESDYQFGDDCYFINFNYTDTLQKRFGIPEKDDYHIHGDAEDVETIVVGHAKHPEMAFPELFDQKMIHGWDGKKSLRLQGLFFVEQALYETDKHIQDNIDDLCEFMALSNVHIEDITDIYVLGHSFGESDFEYFDFLVQATQKSCDLNSLSALYKIREVSFDEIDEESLSNFVFLNIEYATGHRKRALEKEDMHFPVAEMVEEVLFGQVGVCTDQDGNVYPKEASDEKAREAVRKRFLFEQALRTKETIEELCMLKNVHELPDDCYSVLTAADSIDGGHTPRIEDAKWHVSYFSEADKKRIENVFMKIGFSNYELVQGIDACIQKYQA